MNERKIHIKLLRHLIQLVYKDQTKTINIDDCLEGNLIDEDITTLDYILNSIKVDELTLERVLNIYKKLSKNKLDILIVEKAEELVEYYIEGATEQELFKYIMLREIFEEFNFPMAIIIFNLLYYKQNKKFLIFFYKLEKHIDSIIKLDEKETLFFTNLININKDYSIKKYPPSFEKTREILISNFNMYKEKFKLTRIGVFGSFARGTQNEYSDIDILVESDSHNLEEVSKKLISYLINDLGKYIDLKINKTGKEPKGFLKNCYKHAVWFNK